MGKANAYLLRVQNAINDEKEKTRAHVLQHTLDVCTIALGRLGWRQKRLERFVRTVEQVINDYDELIRDDQKFGDKDIVYTIGKFEQELKAYCGDKYWPREQRYM